MSRRSTDDYVRWAAQLLALVVAFGLLLATPFARAAERDGAEPPVAAVDAVVEELVRDALAANLELDAAGAEVWRRVAALDEARARYLPALDLNARYSAADGGRVIEVPVGDLLNPVYATLNQLTGQNQFPTVANQQIPLQRSREQDTRLSLTQPLYDARLRPAREASAAQYDAASAARTALAGRIDRDMRTAYTRWLETRARREILDATLELARANQRVNESLYANGKITRDLVYRAEADVLEVEQSRLAADKGVHLAQSYVNLIRNAPFDRALPVATLEDADLDRLRTALGRRLGQPSLAPQALAATAIDRRAELKQLDATVAAAAAGERLARAAFQPQLALAVDAGTQGERYGLSADDRYVLASVVLRFNLYAGGGDTARVAAAHALGRQARDQRDDAELRIRLEVQQVLDNLEVAMASLGTAAKRVEAARSAFRIAERKRDLGAINQAEFLDARRALTDAALNQNVTRFAALASLANLEYAIGAGARPSPPEPLP
ncbi:MAG TPA: TolC family protein [Steroidobacteraceae bacterium]|nr:TolC family protein [Steroidobacteraceae bacterium]